ncbi:F-box/kelch-repeat protein At3g23880-like [Lycium ferocissimum]|uniref:F-box/kelch-repeat protein At3g23880-like n=1 Tax=Lycium ferocissimum TaxID=112874 RepID=UPI0028160247|nr:F-box/kelch-repeat protein At3g23880-like [Lycium ferocissimum]
MPNNYIIHDNIIDILIKLPVKSLIRFKLVCKLWRSVIEDGQFINLHHDQCKSDYKNCQNQKICLACYGMETKQICHYSMDVPYSLQCDSVVSLLEPPTTVQCARVNVYVDSCSGLFVLSFSAYNVVLWNPAIRESRTIPSPISIHGKDQIWVRYGLGYDNSSDDYIIVRVGLIYHPDPDGHNVQIFSTKSDSWKLINEKLPVTYEIQGNIVVADHGIVYMIIKESSDNKFILALCLKNEKFEEILFQGRRDLIMEQPNLFTVGECLCLAKFCSPIINELANFEVWRMTKNGTLSYSWSKLFAITVPVPDDERVMTKYHVRPVSFMKDGGMLFRRSRDELVVYDSKTQKFEQVKIAGLEVASPFLYRGLTYVETLISPNAL